MFASIPKLRKIRAGMAESENLSGLRADQVGKDKAWDRQKVSLSELPENNLATGFVGTWIGSVVVKLNFIKFELYTCQIL